MRTLLAISLLALSLPLQAQPDPNDDGDQEPPFSYLFLSGAITHDRDKSIDVTSDGFSLGGSVDLTESAFLTGGYSQSSTGRFRVGATEGEVEDQGFSIGLGGHKSLSRRSDLTTSLAYVNGTTTVREIGGASADERSEGVSASLGLRHLIHPWIEIGAGSSYSFISGERGWDWSGGLGFMMTRKVWMDVDYYNSGGSDSDGWSIGLRTVLGVD